jgi:hypothetical protein
MKTKSRTYDIKGQHHKVRRNGTKQDGLKEMVRLFDFMGKLTKISHFFASFREICTSGDVTKIVSLTFPPY